MRMRMRIIFEGEYDADPKDYGTDDPAEMARMDLKTASYSYSDAFEWADPDSIRIRIEPISS